ncbi:MAG TPA: DNA replication/repair protein RecF [Atribacterota bacterium]|nr:DNA replication/repair protein RecF [Atribacterota bacterium]
MDVNKLRLVCFRNFLDTTLNFNNSLNILIGNNAQGKTNIIEAIYTLLRGGTYRTKDDSTLINWQEKQGYLSGEVSKDSESFQINILFQNIEKLNPLSPKTKKIIKVNKKYRSKSWLTERFYPVIFTPEDLQIIKSSPSLRRKFLDEVIINLNPTYEHYLRDYNRILFQRNILLKTERNKHNLDRHLSEWDQKIVEAGSLITWYRIKTLQLINQKVKTIHQLMTEPKETLKLKYNSNFLTTFLEEKEEIQKVFEQKLENARDKDLTLKVTTIGPHRDDYSILSDSIDLGLYGSQGQQRTVVLALKMAELELIREKDGEYPPLLLDDVLSELDAERRLFLIKLIKEKPIQTFITSIDLQDFVPYHIVESARVFKVRGGMVEENEK